MDEQQAVDAASRLLGPAAQPSLTSTLWDWAPLLAESVTIDAAGHLPGQPGYAASYDAHWLAAQAAYQIARWSAGDSHTTKLSVDGDSIERTVADWGSVADDLLAASPLSALLPAGGGGYLVPLQLESYGPTSTQVGG